MKTLINKQQNSFASTFRFFFVLIALIALNFVQPAMASGTPDKAANEQLASTSVILPIGQQMSGYQIISVENLIEGEDGFEGTWWTAMPTEDMRNVLFAHTSGPRNLPANTEVALVTVNDTEAGIYKQFLLSTDGGAVVMILADF